MILEPCPTNQQDHLVLDPKDANNQVVVLDEGALTVTKISGPGTFEVNQVTNQAVFRPPTEASDEPTVFLAQVDGQPGQGEFFLEEEFTQPSVAVPAVTAGFSVTREANGSPA